MAKNSEDEMFLGPHERPFFDHDNDHRITARRVAPGQEPELYEGVKNPSAQEMALNGYESLSLAKQSGWNNKDRPALYKEAEDFDHDFIYPYCW